MWSREAEASSRRPSARVPHSPPNAMSPLYFTRGDQRPSSGPSGMVSFGGSDEELALMSLAAYKCKDWANSRNDSAPLPPKQSDDARPHMDTELFASPYKSFKRARLGSVSPRRAHPQLKRLLQPRRHQQGPRQRPAPFLPEVHQELTKVWCAPYSACVHSSSSAALSTVDGTKEKGYTK